MHQRPLISPLELAALLRGGPEHAPLLLDVRWKLGSSTGYQDYLDAHIPGAIFVDLDTDLAGTRDEEGRGGRHPMPHPDDFELDMAECGVDNGRMVVVYDDWRNTGAARCWWLLRHFGKADVAVLDGGLQAWRAHRLPTESGPRELDEGDFSIGRGPGLAISAEQAALYAAEGILIDARTPERFRGESDPIDTILGHIPGAVNVPGASLLTADNTLLPAAELRRRFEEVGVDGSKPVAVYCGSGVTSSLVQLALDVAELDHEAALYVGSWSDWVSDPTRPIESGASRHLGFAVN